MLLLVVAVWLWTVAQQAVSGHKAALIIVDVQDCFLEGGSLAVPDGPQVAHAINVVRKKYEEKFSMVVLTQDWHCPDHVSFASQHPGKEPFSVIDLTYNVQGALCFGEHVPKEYPHAVDCSEEALADRMVISQTLWPDHCVMNVTSGPTSAAISPHLIVKESDIIVRKGYSCGVDSYSAFYDNGRFIKTELDDILKERGIDLVVVTGLALEVCVYYTAKDAHTLGYKVIMVPDACKGVAPDSVEAALKDLKAIGVELVQTADLEGALQDPNQVGEPSSLSLTLMVVAGALFTAYLALRTRS